jgi:hypothetical protein
VRAAEFSASPDGSSRITVDMARVVAVTSGPDGMANLILEDGGAIIVYTPYEEVLAAWEQ